MSKKRNGDIGEQLVILDLMKQGFTVSVPISEDCAYDILTELNGEYTRYQVKSTTKTHGKDNNKAHFCVTHGSKKDQSYENVADILALVHIPSGSIWYYPVQTIINKSMRVEIK